MAATPVSIPHTERFSEWFRDFLKKEFAPYPGRGALVARIVISATLTMILLVTFRIPGGVVGALAAFVLSRENLVSTARSAVYLAFAFLVGALFIPVGARLLASTPEIHFLWVGCSLFIVLYSASLSRAVCSGRRRLALVISNVIGIWYLPGPAEANVELTLWTSSPLRLSAYSPRRVRGSRLPCPASCRDDLIDGLDTRLALLEDLMANYAAGRAVSPATQAGLAQFAIVGAGALRRHVARATYDQLYRARMSTMVSLTSRSIDFAAALASTYPSFLPGYEDRLGQLQRSLADIRACLIAHGQPCEATLEPKPSPSTPLLSEIESMVALMPSVFSQQNATDPTLEPLEDAPDSGRIFIPDAFSNPDHLRYVLGGTMASMLCYVFYVSLAWPGLSTSVTTCVLTALTTIGSSPPETDTPRRRLRSWRSHLRPRMLRSSFSPSPSIPSADSRYCSPP